MKPAPSRPRATLFFGLSLAGPTMVTHGSDDLRRRSLRPMFTGEEIWCQLFSEPGAGSDLAGLATRAVRDGEEWVVNGQKVWNTLAHLADRGMLVARTDPELPKHKGLTYFMVDMHAPGVEVRPLRQITGEAEFNEVYFTDARIADADRIGDIGDGWRVSMTTLMNERTTIGGREQRRWHELQARVGHPGGDRPLESQAGRRSRSDHPRPHRAAVDRERSAALHEPARRGQGRAPATPGPKARSPSSRSPT